MPLVEKTYKVSKKADDRAIAGLSMGGGQTVNIAFNRPELFRYVVLDEPRGQRRTPSSSTRVLQGSVGRRTSSSSCSGCRLGKDDTLVGAGDKALRSGAHQERLNHTFKFVEGRHEWTVWRHNLNESRPCSSSSGSELNS